MSAIPSLASAPVSRAAVGARGELGGWAWLAVGALAIAGVFAILLALSRIPGVESVLPWMVDFFYKGLVIHVVFSLAIWLINVIAFIVSYATCEIAGARLSALGRIGQGFVLVAFPCLFAPAFFPSAEPRLVNYIPLIGHPLYDIGLVLLALGVLMPVARLFANLPGSSVAPLAARLRRRSDRGHLCRRADQLRHRRPRAGAERRSRQRARTVQLGRRPCAAIRQCGADADQLGDSRPPELRRQGARRALFKLALGLVAAFVLPTLAFYFVFDPFGAKLHEAYRFLQFGIAAPAALVGHFRTQRRAEIWAVEDVALARSGLRRARNFDGAVRRRRRDGACDHRLRYAHARALSRRGDGGLGVEHGAAAHLRPQNARPQRRSARGPRARFSCSMAAGRCSLRSACSSPAATARRARRRTAPRTWLTPRRRAWRCMASAPSSRSPAAPLSSSLRLSRFCARRRSSRERRPRGRAQRARLPWPDIRLTPASAALWLFERASSRKKGICTDESIRP